MTKASLLLAALVTIGSHAGTSAPCEDIAVLEKTLKQSKTPQKVLFRMGKLAEMLSKEAPLDIEAYRQNPTYKNICRYKIVRSENFGDFPSYGGYHYSQILSKYPDSDLADDAAFALIYVITEDTHNFSDIRIEKKKLKAFLSNYPKSNKAKEAQARIKEIEAQLENGEPAILD